MANVVRDDQLVQIEAPAISLRGDDGTEYARIENGVGTGLLNSGSIPSVSLKQFGAKFDVTTLGSGGTDDSAAWTAALAALPTIGGHPVGVIGLSAGNSRLDTGVDLGPFVSVKGTGLFSSVIDYRGAGDALRVHQPTFPNPGDFTGIDAVGGWGGELSGFRIDGSGSTAGAVGLHLGDIEEVLLDLVVANFAGAGSIGYLFDNAVWWTEKIRGRCMSYDNTQAAKFTVSDTVKTSTNSFEYCDLIFQIYAEAGQSGVWLSNGAAYTNARLTVRANMTQETSPTTYLLKVSGQVPTGHPTANSYSQMTGHLDLQAEASRGSGSGPTTIVIGSPGNNMIVAEGVMGFSNMTKTALPAAGAAIGIQFAGSIVGDNNLVEPTLAATGGVLTLPLDGAKVLSHTLAGNVAVALLNLPSNQPGVWRVKLTQAAAGSKTVDWSSSGVSWAGGTAPTMTATANATDVYELVSFGGPKVFGRIIGQAY